MDNVCFPAGLFLMRIITNGVTRHFALFIGVYFTLFVVVRLVMTSTASVDESEQIMLAQYFAWGYNAQPPLYTWLLQLLFELFGITIFGLALLKSMLLFIAYFFVYKTGKLLTCNEIKASLAALSLMLLSQIIWGAQVDQTHTVLLTSATSMAFYYYFKIALGKSHIVDFVLLGISAAIGLLAKYNFVLVLAGLTTTALLIPSYRKRLFQIKTFISIAVCSIAILPHLLWFLSHIDLATSRSIERMYGIQSGVWLTDTFSGLKDLFIATVAFITPFWLIFLALFRKDWQRDSSQETKAILIYIGAVLYLLILIILATGTTNIKERWLQPYLYIFPLLLFMQTSLKQVTYNVRIYIFTSLGMALFIAVIMIAAPRMIDHRGKPSRTNFPFKEISYQLQDTVNGGSLIYAEDMFIGGNLLLSFPNVTVITPSLPMQPYTIRDDVVIAYRKHAPKQFLEKLNDAGFVCKGSSIEENYRHSEEQTYTLSIIRCHKG